MAITKTMDQRVLNVEALQAIEQSRTQRLHALTPAERSELLIAACRAAGEIEASRRRMGLPASRPVPWPESTRQFLAEAARRVREG